MASISKRKLERWISGEEVPSSKQLAELVGELRKRQTMANDLFTALESVIFHCDGFDVSGKQITSDAARIENEKVVVRAARNVLKAHTGMCEFAET